MKGSKGSRFYRIEIEEEIDVCWSSWFDGMRIEEHEGRSVLFGSIDDRAELYGVVQRIRDLGLTLRKIEQVEEKRW